MPTSPKSAFRLETEWSPATSAESLSYRLTLTNLSAETFENFRLCVSGPARIDPAAIVEGGSLAERLSNHAEFAPPQGFVLAPSASWTMTARGLELSVCAIGPTARPRPMSRSRTARRVPVAVTPTRASGDNAPLKRGAEIYPVPAEAPVPISVVPWPADVAYRGAARRRRAWRSSPTGDEASAAAEAFRRSRRRPFPGRGYRPACRRGRLSRSRFRSADGFGPEAYAIRFAHDGAPA